VPRPWALPRSPASCVLDGRPQTTAGVVATTGVAPPERQSGFPASLACQDGRWLGTWIEVADQYLDHVMRASLREFTSFIEYRRTIDKMLATEANYQ
jgi:hypothetical protein